MIPEILVIPDGAGEAVRRAAYTPILDGLAADGEATYRRTCPAGLAPGSETCIPALLGVFPVAPVGRGRVDAAAYGVPVPPGLIPWRADARHADGSRAPSSVAAALAARSGVPAVATNGHRLLLFSATKPAAIPGLHVWDDGPPPSGELPVPTAIVCAPGAAAGIGRLLGAHVVTPAAATGDVDTDLEAKLDAALALSDAGWARVVVHVGGVDEAAHRLRAGDAIAMLERIDRELLAPLRDHLMAIGGHLVVCADHGTDPRTGQHVEDPVLEVHWRAR